MLKASDSEQKIYRAGVARAAPAPRGQAAGFSLRTTKSGDVRLRNRSDVGFRFAQRDR